MNKNKEFPSLEGKTIMVTGASSGIGKAIALRLADENAKVALLARNQDKLKAVSSEIRNKGGVCKDFICDVRDPQQVKNCLEEIVSFFGNIDALVNNAGILSVCPLFSAKEKEIRAIIDTNISGMIYCSKYFILELRKTKKKGVILNMSSISGISGQPGLTVYAASKGAVIAFTKSLALEMAAYGVRVNAIAPGIIETPSTEKLFRAIGEAAKQKIIDDHPMGVGQARDIASAACFLLSEESSWITGTILNVDGGYTA